MGLFILPSSLGDTARDVDRRSDDAAGVKNAFTLPKEKRRITK
jgi:hypothetical protein